MEDDDGDDRMAGFGSSPPDAAVVDPNRVYSFRLLGRFAEEVASRIRQYKDELLVACVRFLLGLPVQLSAKPVLLPALHVCEMCHCSALGCPGLRLACTRHR